MGAYFVLGLCISSSGRNDCGSIGRRPALQVAGTVCSTACSLVARGRDVPYNQVSMWCCEQGNADEDHADTFFAAS